jgi:two-component system, cell cycle sensor histidine kinase and response regulator CckA
MNAYRVLIVEPDLAETDTLTRMLHSEGYSSVMECRTTRDALGAIAKDRPDIVLADSATSDYAQCQQSLSATGVQVVEIVGADAKPQSLFFIRKPYDAREIAAVLRAMNITCAKDASSSNGALTLECALSFLPAIVIWTDAKGDVAGMNASAELFARRTSRSLADKHFSEAIKLLCEKTLQPFSNPEEIIADIGVQSSKVLLAEKSDGSKQRVNVRCARVRDHSGNIASYFLYISILPDTGESEIRQRLLDVALETVDCAVFITDTGKDGCEPVILSCNASFEYLTGLGRNEVVGKTVSVLSTTTREAYWTEMMDTLSSGQPWRGEGAVNARQGHEFIGLWSANTVDQDGKIAAYVFTVRDNTPVVRMEESLRQSQKIEAVGRLASGIAHDFNNLLSVINSYSDLQIMKLDEGSPSMKYAQQIRAAGRKGVDLVSQLMTFSRKDRPNPIAMDLSQVVEEVKGMLRRVIREDIEMETHHQEKIYKVKADQGQIEQILLNLCVNARDAMPNGGKLNIEVINRDYDKTLIREHDVIHPGKYVVLCVTDSGCGMDEETQKRIFDPFFTTKEIGKGTGLGLATVQSIVKQYNGHIIVKSRPGEGSRFELLFPACEVTSDIAGNTQIGNGPAPTGNEKVFIVEDDETFLDCISGLLRLHGYQVFAANDGSAALEMLGRINYEVDMLVSDLVLPKLSGREIAARLLEKNPKVKVLFMTGYDDQLDTFYSLPNDAKILEKPFPLNSMLIKIRELLDEKLQK